MKDFIKKFAREISVFGLVLVVFLGLFIYRQVTYATYTTLSSTKFEQKIENKDSFILVAGDSSDSAMKSFQEVMTTYQTKNRKNKIYYVDTKGKSSNYLTKKLNVNISTPCTFIIKKAIISYFFFFFISNLLNLLIILKVSSKLFKYFNILINYFIIRIYSHKTY